VTPSLTLNLGLRYEVSLPRTERFNRMNWLDPNISYSLTAPGFPDFPVKGGEVFAGSKNRYNYDTFYKAFQPRFGFAYSAGRGFVIRGGYGIYFSQPRSELLVPDHGDTRATMNRRPGFQHSKTNLSCLDRG